MKYSYSEYIPILKALSDETRLKIIDMLSCQELCANEILEEFKITQPTLSYHMKILIEAELVRGNRQGAFMHYSLNQNKSGELIDFLKHISSEKEECNCNNIRNKERK